MEQMKTMKKKKVQKTEEEISDEIKQSLFEEINNDEIIKSLKTGKESDCLIPMKKSKQ